MTSIEIDMSAHADLRDSRRIAARAGTGEAPNSGELDERVADHLRPVPVARLFDEARRARAGASGEPERRRFRSVARAFLDRASAVEDQEIDRRSERGSAPAGGFEAELIQTADPQERRAVLARWAGLEGELEQARAARAGARAQAAARASAASTTAFLEVEQPRAASEVLESFRRGAIEPLDEPVLQAVRRRQGLHPADLPAVAAVVDRVDLVPGPAIPAALRALGGVLGIDPDTAALQIVRPADWGAWPELLFAADGCPRLLLGGLAGPLALARSVACLGRAARGSFLRSRRGHVVRCADPGFDHAVAAVFARLVLTRRFAEWIRIGSHAVWVADLRLELALAPRRAWAYLWLAVERPVSEDRQPDGATVEEAMQRAVHRPSIPTDHVRALDSDPGGVAELRGTVYGLLLEEQLMTRFGSDWFAQRGALRWLQEGWEVEPDETLESMAAGLGLGTIEPTPMLDRCRP